MHSRSEFANDSAMIEKAHSVINHLEVESKFLDFVIQSSEKMQTLLRYRNRVTDLSTDDKEKADVSPKSAPKSQSEPQPATESNQLLAKRLTEIRKEIAKRFLPVMEGRKAMVEIMNSIVPDQSRTPSVSALALKVDEPVRSRLKNLRNEIREKMNRVQAISLGSQAVLLYTVDFYNRLLTGLSPECDQSKYYSATGRSQTRHDINLIQANC